MKFRKTTAALVISDLHKLAREASSWPIDARRELAVEVNKLLDLLLGQDAFGTEGQLDPRGDHRE